MSDLMKLIQEADIASVEYEKARGQVEAAKLTLEMAKDHQEQARAALDEIVSRADEYGVPRAKMKKLIEERTQSLMASGLISSAMEVRVGAATKARTSKKTKIVSDEAEKDEFVPDMVIEEDRVVELN